MTIQKAIAQVGIAIQTVKGTPIANPTFTHGITDGGLFTLDISQDRAPLTSSVRVSPQVDRTGVVAGFSFTTRLFSKTLGAYLYAALGSKSVTGAGPYTHTISPGATLPYLTMFGKLDGELRAVQDCIVDSLEIDWDSDGIANLKVSGMGTLANFAPTFTGTTDDSFATYMVANGGLLKYVALGTTTAVAPVKSGSLKINNNADPIMLAASVVPNEVFWGRQDYEVGLTLVPQNLNDWRTFVTGGPAGTTVAEAAVYGAFDLKLINGTDSVQFVANRVPYTAPYPSADPSGGRAELEIGGLPVLTAAGAAALTVTLINGQATY